MYTKELLAFITVAETGSFLKAAKKLYLTPASWKRRRALSFWCAPIRARGLRKPGR